MGFRWFAASVAREYGVAGYVRNLPSGEVEALAEGTAEVVDRFVSALRCGPAGTRVSGLEIREVRVGAERSRFEIRG